MSQYPIVLIIGKIDLLKKLSVEDYFDTSFTANYEEAIELLNESEFNYVITDALISKQKSALNMLRHLSRIRKFPTTFVCHHSSVCQTKLGDWFIETSLKAHYPEFASFYLGSIESCLHEVLASIQDNT